MRGEIVSDETYNHSQSWWRKIVAIDGAATGGATGGATGEATGGSDRGGRKNLRYTVCYNAYRFQSYGRVERWSGARWEAVHELAGEQLEGYDGVSYTSKSCDPAHFEDDLLELDRVAGMVLGLD